MDFLLNLLTSEPGVVLLLVAVGAVLTASFGIAKRLAKRFSKYAAKTPNKLDDVFAKQLNELLEEGEAPAVELVNSEVRRRAAERRKKKS